MSWGALDTHPGAPGWLRTGSGPAETPCHPCPYSELEGEGLGDLGAIYQSRFLSLLQLGSPSARSIPCFSLRVGLKVGEGVGGSDGCMQTPGL